LPLETHLLVDANSKAMSGVGPTCHSLNWNEGMDDG
jgi:hypothetical protein